MSAPQIGDIQICIIRCVSIVPDCSKAKSKSQMRYVVPTPLLRTNGIAPTELRRLGWDFLLQTGAVLPYLLMPRICDGLIFNYTELGRIKNDEEND